jgi:hypothetical protein
MGPMLRALAIAAAVIAAATGTSVGLAATPTIERIAIDETFHDDFLSDVCGIDVEVHALGHRMTRLSSGDDGRLIETSTVNISFTATSAEGRYRFRDVGADVTRITKDGVVVQVIGKLPFWFNGVVWIDLNDFADPFDDEIIKGPTGPDLFGSMLEAACSALHP